MGPHIVPKHFRRKDSDRNKLIDTPYHDSWDWLMLVVEKIEDLGYEICIINNECEIATTGYHNATFISQMKDTKIESVYAAVIEFIKLYNNDKLRILEEI